MKMPFGKYKARELRDVPSDYLLWLLDGCDSLRPALRRYVLAELDRRECEGEPSGKALSVVSEVIGPWYRALSRQFHPDHGGSHDGMKAINAARELLVKMTEAA